MLSGPRPAFVAGVILFAGLCAAPAPRAAAQIVPGSREVPRFRAPDLFPGFEPVAPDSSGLSPRGRFIVIQDSRGLRVVRTADSAEVFRDSLARNTEVGFDPFDRRMYVTSNDRLTYRFRFVHPDTGRILLDDRVSERPDIRINLDGTANVLTLRRGNTGQVNVFNDAGRVTHRRNMSSFAQVGINRYAPVVALLDRRGGTRIDLVLLNAEVGRITVREAISAQFEAGFEPLGTAFVIARATSPGSFRIRMVNGYNGRFLVNRTFFGPVNAGFTDDSRFLGVKSRQGAGDRVYLFQTTTGGTTVARGGN